MRDSTANLLTYRIGVDVGGTFTDAAVSSSDGTVSVFKSPTTVPDHGLGGLLNVLGLAADELEYPRLEELLGRCEYFLYSTTRGLNAIITGNAARTALLVTAGHRDVLMLREGGKSRSFDLHVPYPKPYVPRSLTFELDERITSEGDVHTPLDPSSVKRVLSEVGEAGVEAVAVSLLWSIVNPEHERLVGELIETELPGIPYTLSHELNPIIREFRRTSSTAIDASMKPMMSAYLDEVHARLREHGMRGAMLCATCAGGAMPMEEIVRRPIETVNSGPSLAPVSGHHYYKKRLDSTALPGDGVSDGESPVIVVDTGGTSFDVSLIEAGRVRLTSDFSIGDRYTGHVLGLPAVDVHSVGAGGGSIGWVDPGGLLRVGPQSAGADPGPAAYDRGGELPTVTDAAVVLGYLDPDHFLGGRMKLKPELSARAIDRHLAALGLDTHEAASALLTVVDEHMVNAIREITLDQGIDPRESVIVAGGGASGLSINRIVEQLGCREVLIPRVASGLSACGAVLSDLVRDFRAAHFTTSSAFDYEGVNATLADLRARGDEFLERVPHSLAARELTGFAAVRYGYQIWELEIPLETLVFDTVDDVGRLADAFHREHERVFAVADATQGLEFVGWRVRVTGRMTAMAARPGDRGEAQARTNTRTAFFRGHGWCETPVIRGGTVGVEGIVPGPAIVEEPGQTIVVQEGSQISVTGSGDWLLTCNAPAAREGV